MTKQEILNLFKSKNIISENNKRKHCWKKNFDKEAEQIFNEFKKSYRTDNETWFCLLNNVEPHHCEICGNLAKFTGNKKSKNIGYNTTCENCSPNAVKSKKQKFNKTIKSRTPEEKLKIFEKRKHTMLERYGDENYSLIGSKSFQENMLIKYGVKYTTQITKVKEKIKQTNLNKYGVDCLFKSKEFREKSLQVKREKYGNPSNSEKTKQTCLKKYGVESVNQLHEKIDKQMNTLKEHYGDIKTAYKIKTNKSKETKLKNWGDSTYHNKEQVKETLLNREKEFEKNNNCTKYNKLIEQYGQGWKILNIPIIYDGRFRYIENKYISEIKNYSEKEHNLISVSHEEKELYNYIKSIIKTKIYRNRQDIISDSSHKYELDIYIPKLKIAFEFNGIYWHSTEYKQKYYHQIKTKLCYEKGIQLIHIWENEWNDNKELIKQHIKELLSGKDCSEYNWIPVSKYNNYILSEPKEIKIGTLTIFNEGKFIKK